MKRLQPILIILTLVLLCACGKKAAQNSEHNPPQGVVERAQARFNQIRSNMSHADLFEAIGLPADIKLVGGDSSALEEYTQFKIDGSIYLSVERGGLDANNGRPLISVSFYRVSKRQGENGARVREEKVGSSWVAGEIDSTPESHEYDE